MLSDFFIDRPNFSIVVSVVIVLAGLIALWVIPVAQFPDITPPVIQLQAYYPGADSQVVADTVAAPIEEQVNGAKNMLYMSSTSADGSYTLNVTFAIGTNPDLAQVDVQNRLALATPRLPSTVVQQGISVKRQSTSSSVVRSWSSARAAWAACTVRTPPAASGDVVARTRIAPRMIVRAPLSLSKAVRPSRSLRLSTIFLRRRRCDVLDAGHMDGPASSMAADSRCRGLLKTRKPRH